MYIHTATPKGRNVGNLGIVEETSSNHHLGKDGSRITAINSTTDKE